MSGAGPGIATLIRAKLRLRPGEGAVVGLVWIYAFCVLACNYVLRPLRDDLGVVAGPDQLAWSYTGTFILTAIASPLFAALVTRWPRRRFIPYLHRGSAVLLLGVFALFQFGPARMQQPCAWLLFAWISTFNLLAVSVFWGFLADVLDPEAARRLFGLLAAGATLGAIGGSAFVSTFAPNLNSFQFALAAVVLLEVANLAVRRLSASAPPAVEAQTVVETTVACSPAATEADLRRGGAWGGIAATMRSTYLQGICVYLLLMTATSTFVYYEQARLIDEQLPDPAARKAYFARTDLCVNMLCLLAQMLLTGRLIGRLGVGRTAALLPLVTLAGFSLLSLQHGASAALPVLFWFQVLRRASDYGISRPAREVFFTVVSRADKYKAKSFIDTFIYRGGDLAAIWLYQGFRSGLGGGIREAAVAVAIACIGWIGLSLGLGSAYRRRARAVAAGHADPRGQLTGALRNAAPAG